MVVTLVAVTPDPENVIEFAGRTCYMSEGGDAGEFIRKRIKSGHESILEHASATFLVQGASRSFTHQLVRHRIASYSQQSQRYVGEDNFHYVTPPSIASNEEALAVFTECMENCRGAYMKLREMAILKEDARFVLPNATESEIVFTANFREFRNMIKLRCDSHAQWEIRNVFRLAGRDLLEIAPNTFSDLESLIMESK